MPGPMLEYVRLLNYIYMKTILITCIFVGVLVRGPNLAVLSLIQRGVPLFLVGVRVAFVVETMKVQYDF